MQLTEVSMHDDFNVLRFQILELLRDIAFYKGIEPLPHSTDVLILDIRIGVCALKSKLQSVAKVSLVRPPRSTAYTGYESAHDAFRVVERDITEPRDTLEEWEIFQCFKKLRHLRQYVFLLIKMHALK